MPFGKFRHQLQYHALRLGTAAVRCGRQSAREEAEVSNSPLFPTAIAWATNS